MLSLGIGRIRDAEYSHVEYVLISTNKQYVNNRMLILKIGPILKCYLIIT